MECDCAGIDVDKAQCWNGSEFLLCAEVLPLLKPLIAPLDDQL